jgi:hypothetical protein
MVDYYPNTKLGLPGWHTVLCEVGKLLNSCPLCWDPTCLSWEEVLTPSHFLTQQIQTETPKELGSEKLLTHHWKQVKEYSEELWNRWSNESLKLLAQVQLSNPKPQKLLSKTLG